MAPGKARHPEPKRRHTLFVIQSTVADTKDDEVGTRLVKSTVMVPGPWKIMVKRRDERILTKRLELGGKGRGSCSGS